MNIISEGDDLLRTPTNYITFPDHNIHLKLFRKMKFIDKTHPT